MSISNRLYDYLDRHHVKYETLVHQPTLNSHSSALAANIPMHQMAKAVVLEDHEGRRLLALLPASHKINLGKIGDDLCRSFHLVKEQQVYELFGDCAKGAVPSLGESYNMETVFDDLLSEQHDVYLEGGDHSTLVHLTQDEFKRLMQGHRHSRFSAQVFH